MRTGIMRMTTGVVPVGTRLAASLQQRSMVEGMVETTTTCATSTVLEMHVAGYRTGIRNGSVMSRNSMMRGTMRTTAATTINLIGNILLTEDTFQEASRLIPETSKGFVGP
jgi:hypothetical protein